MISRFAVTTMLIFGGFTANAQTVSYCSGKGAIGEPQQSIHFRSLNDGALVKVNLVPFVTKVSPALGLYEARKYSDSIVLNFVGLTEGAQFNEYPKNLVITRKANSSILLTALLPSGGSRKIPMQCKFN